MSTIEDILAKPPPKTVQDALGDWPDRSYRKSPSDWRDQIFYFLLPDRFSNGQEQPDRLLDVDLSTSDGLQRIKGIRGPNWMWDNWQSSGADRFQGGTLKGIQSKLAYLNDLGIKTIWIGPVFRQRVELNTYHGYGIQNFFDVDPRFGARQDLIDLVDAAHNRDMNIVLDVIFNHSGCNWLYDNSAGDLYEPSYRQSGGYEPIWPRNGFGTPIYDSNQTLGDDDYVWPRELHDYRSYLRAGTGNLGAGDINYDHAEHKRTDFCNLRKFNLFSDNTLLALVLVYQYWIALSDIDGFRIDTFKHVTQNQARNFCNAIKEYAEILGKERFFLVAEVAGGNDAQQRYLNVTGRNLDACLDIGEQRERICGVSKGLQQGEQFFSSFDYYDGMGSHRNYGSRHLNISNDHDHVFGKKTRISADASNDHQAAATAALQLFTLGIPCIYYGMEQGLASGVEEEERKYISQYGGHDCLLREAMFGPEHPLASGYDGTQGILDQGKAGFGPHGTAGWHVFNPNHPIYTRIAQMAKARKAYLPLRRGRQYPRDTSFLDHGFAQYGPGEILAWSRIFDDQEILIVINTHGNSSRGAKVLVDHRLSTDGMRVILNTDPTVPPDMQPGAFIQALHLGDIVCIPIETRLLGPSEIMVLGNESAIKEAIP
jgi:glycosidase